MKTPNTRREFLADVGRGMLVATVGSQVASELGLSSFAGETPAPLIFGAIEPLVQSKAISEIMVLIAKGCPVRLAAPLPDEIQNSTTYFAAVMADAAAQMAGSLVRFLTTSAAKSAFAATGID